MMGWVLALIFGVTAAVCAALAWRTSREARRRSDARVAGLAATIDPPDRSVAAPVGAPMPAALNPLAKVGIGFAAVTSAIIAAALVIDAAERRPAVPDQPPTLELVTMQPQRQNGALTVSGLVRNSGDRPAVGIVAEITVVDRAGETVGTRRAPIAVRSLPPDANSPFSVTFDGIGDAPRYRIAFRDAERVVRHVDRRAAVNAPATAGAASMRSASPASRPQSGS